MSWYLSVLKKYAKFSGRARRKEYWMFVLLNLIVVGLLYVPMFVLNEANLVYLPLAYTLLTFLPGLAVVVRRLHDTGRSGAWFFIALVPFIGGLWLLILLLGEGQTEDNAYGPNPKAA